MGRVNQPYSVYITVKGEAIGVTYIEELPNNTSLIGKSADPNLHVDIELEEGIKENEMKYTIIISGVPSQIGEHIITIAAERPSTMRRLGDFFSKGYTLKVTE